MSDRLDRAAAAIISEPIEIPNAEAYGGDEFNGIRIVPLGHDGDYLTAYGHLPGGQFAAACDDSQADMAGGEPMDSVDPGAVDHVYAVMNHDELADEDDGYAVRWHDIQPDHYRAFPLTVWCADWQ